MTVLSKIYYFLLGGLNLYLLLPLFVVSCTVENMNRIFLGESPGEIFSR